MAATNERHTKNKFEFYYIVSIVYINMMDALFLQGLEIGSIF